MILCRPLLIVLFFFFFNDTATTEIYTLSLHDALPISRPGRGRGAPPRHARNGPGLPAWPARAPRGTRRGATPACPCQDRKSTRLNSSHANISYAVFCLKKKNTYYIMHSSSIPYTYDQP